MSITSVQRKIVWGNKPYLLFALAIALLPGKAVWAQPHARLSPSLQKNAATSSAVAVDVIIQA
jgi:hypothetical protein